jgi:hypothetical protein
MCILKVPLIRGQPLVRTQFVRMMGTETPIVHPITPNPTYTYTSEIWAPVTLFPATEQSGHVLGLVSRTTNEIEV